MHWTVTPLPVTPDITVSSDETVISGVTGKGVTVQCIVTNGTNTFDKQIKTNGTGKFTFKVPTALEADYHFTLVFSKKNFDTKRFTGNATRNLSDEDRRLAIKKEAVKPGYSNLVKNLDTYINKIMGYNLYIVDVIQIGNEYYIKTAMVKNNAGYKNYLFFITDEEPDVEIDTQKLMYGTCIGPYVVPSEEGEEKYPAFDLLYME